MCFSMCFNSLNNKTYKINIKLQQTTMQTTLKNKNNDEAVLTAQGLRAMVDKIGTLQKPEHIELLRIIVNNKEKYNETSRGITIVLNGLKRDTLLKMHKLVEYATNIHSKLDEDAQHLNKLRQEFTRCDDTTNNNMPILHTASENTATTITKTMHSNDNGNDNGNGNIMIVLLREK